ncbi:NRDE family protein [Paraglaciecola aquimarina]|uniref:NRDE family protein n=1 Tax=Paraglaciecola algarum TaxID=3050085 RepID=A0ABS9D4A1_9ALTE|nr:NRDE family protein [Paraglaciecola sp. G1-23]MCF2946853.1 NRDE family protein [Paraglaciecola sp. G1-23]
MCILFVAVNQHKDYPLIIAANRDEFFNRQTAESHFWPKTEQVLAGKDLVAGGSWMGINQDGFIAALTNIRNPEKVNNQAITRGTLVSQYLETPNVDYAQTLAQTKHQYNGYNLLFGQWNKLSVYNNHLDTLQALDTGVYGLSNANLNSPWPKIQKGVSQLEEYCRSDFPIDANTLFELLLDNTKADDPHLPKTGVPIELERHLSSIFIQGDDYGTRSSTVLTIDKNHKVNWQERTYNSQAVCTSKQNFHFNIN